MAEKSAPRRGTGWLYDREAEDPADRDPDPSLIYPIRRGTKCLYNNWSSGWFLGKRQEARRTLWTEGVVLVRMTLAVVLWCLIDPGEWFWAVLAIVLIYDVTIVYLVRLLDKRISEGGPSELGASPARNLFIAGINVISYTMLFAAIYEYCQRTVSGIDAVALSWSSFTTLELKADLPDPAFVGAIEVAIALFMLTVVVAFVVQLYGGQR